MQQREFDLPLPAPLDLAASLAPLGRWGDDGIDRWDGRRLLRVARLDGRDVPYLALPNGNQAAPALRVVAPVSGAAQEQLERAVRATFITAMGDVRDLAERDPAVRSLAARYPGVAPVLVPEPLTALVRSISAQQVNLRWAAEVRRRIARRFGRAHVVGGESLHSLVAEQLARATEGELRELQLTTAKARSVIACARAAADGRLERAELERLGDEELIERLTALPGIGRWSAEWFLARTLGRPRVVAGDLGVRKAVGRLYHLNELPSEVEVRRLTAHWGTAASLAQVLALHDLAENAGRPFRQPVSPSRLAAAPPAARSSRVARRADRP